MRFAVSSLLAGNTALLKHASNVPGCALAIEETFREAGFPRDAFRTLLITASRIPELIADRRVAEAGSKALKKTVLELGGSDPCIVLADADLDDAVEIAVKARYQNAGQRCIAAKRFIVVDAISGAFERKLLEAVRRLKVGDPLQEDTKIGPRARGDPRDDLDHQVQDSIKAGASIAVGGRRLPGKGSFYVPTALLKVQPAMPAFREEVFGPVAAVIRVRDAEQVIATANDSMCGLGGNLWTQDIARGKALAGDIESGQVFINRMTASDLRLRFGDVKHSGEGRELSSRGMQEFVNIQTVWIGPAQAPTQPRPSAE